MKLMKSRSLGAVLALAAILVLTGCTEIVSINDKTQIGFAMEKLESELDDLAGITTEYTADIQGDFSYTVQVFSTASQLTSEQLFDVALLVRDQFSEGVLARTVVSFELTVPEGIVLSMYESPFDITEDELRAELELAAAIGEAYGSTASLTVGDDVGIGVLTPASSPDWDTIRALVGDGSLGRYVHFPLLSVEGKLPPSEITDLVDDILGILTEDFYSSAHIGVGWYDGIAFVDLSAEGVNFVDPAASSVWAEILQVSELLETTDLPGGNLMLYGNGEEMAIVHLGECAEAIEPSESDILLADALAATGSFANLEPGHCTRA